MIVDGVGAGVSVTGVRKEKCFTGFMNKTLDENDDVFFSLSV